MIKNIAVVLLFLFIIESVDAVYVFSGDKPYLIGSYYEVDWVNGTDLVISVETSVIFTNFTDDRTSDYAGLWLVSNPFGKDQSINLSVSFVPLLAVCGNTTPTYTTDASNDRAWMTIDVRNHRDKSCTLWINFTSVVHNAVDRRGSEYLLKLDLFAGDKDSFTQGGFYQRELNIPEGYRLKRVPIFGGMLGNGIIFTDPNPSVRYDTVIYENIYDVETYAPFLWSFFGALIGAVFGFFFEGGIKRQKISYSWLLGYAVFGGYMGWFFGGAIWGVILAAISVILAVVSHAVIVYLGNLRHPKKRSK